LEEDAGLGLVILRGFGGAVIAAHVGAQPVPRPTELVADGAVMAGPLHVFALHVLVEVAPVLGEVGAGEADVAGLQAAGVHPRPYLRPDLCSRSICRRRRGTKNFLLRKRTTSQLSTFSRRLGTAQDSREKEEHPKCRLLTEG
jgi:hypothetical protein